ncbi:cupin domain-containing protein [Nocardia crassostreae]|uniref:cupin domain-containing protein n=1 Tax=Nocardia crassostreae TaxID=53428 RepID=UPI000A03873A|nr:cupin [Nocardia crassostreae]
MTRTILTALAVAATATACQSAPADPAAATTTAKPAPGPLVSAPAAELAWRELPDTGGIKVADVGGDITSSGPYEAFVKFPAGKDNPFHTHTSDLPTVVLAGTFYAVIDGRRTEYPAGSYYNLPADLPHFSGCAPGVDCLLFQYQSDHFDLVPTATP